MSSPRRSSRLRQSTNIDDLVDDTDSDDVELNEEDEEEEEEEQSEQGDVSGGSIYYDVDTAVELLEEGMYDDSMDIEEDDDDDDDDDEYEPDFAVGASDTSGDSDDEANALFAIVSNAFQIRLPRGMRAGRRRRRPRAGQENLEPVPSEEGRELMLGGAFGYNDMQQSKKRKRKDSSGESIKSPLSSPPRSPDYYKHERDRRPLLDTYKIRKPKESVASQLLARQMGNYNDAGRLRILNHLIAQTLIPARIDKIIHFDARCYSGQFSQDGDFFYCCSQNMNVRMYNTENPYDWKYYKTEVYPGGGRWTITDATLTPDNKWIAYSSIDSSVFMAGTQREEEVVEHIDFAYGPRRVAMQQGTGIWSIRFSSDARELIAGANDNSIYVYDIELGKPILGLRGGHSNDVNAVCYGDNNSPHLIFSGSDDSTIKIWDRRSMSSGHSAAGVLCGHLEGITYIDAKGDGRYVLSNSKDQTMKLWDIRKMISPNSFQDPYLGSNFDYRFESYDDVPIRRHPNDCSVVTFRGHSVLRTLIRCHFSPDTSTGERYVITGSEDGRVHIYNLDATVAGVIDVLKDTKNSRPKRRRYNNLNAMFLGASGDSWGSVVRDVSWHPNAPLIACTAWSGYGTDGGSVTVHSWDGGSRRRNNETSTTKEVLDRMSGANKGTTDHKESASKVKENWDDAEDEDEEGPVRERMDDCPAPEILDEVLSNRIRLNYSTAD